MADKKPIGYTKEQTSSMKKLLEQTQKDTGDYVGSGTVTEVPKKKKPKRMQMGGMAGPMTRPGFPARNPAMAGRMMNRLRSVRGGDLGDNRFIARPRPSVMKGGGLARKGVGMALAKGGLVKANGCAQRGRTKGKMM